MRRRQLLGLYYCTVPKAPPNLIRAQVYADPWACQSRSRGGCDFSILRLIRARFINLHLTLFHAFTLYLALFPEFYTGCYKVLICEFLIWNCVSESVARSPVQDFELLSREGIPYRCEILSDHFPLLLPIKNSAPTFSRGVGTARHHPVVWRRRSQQQLSFELDSWPVNNQYSWQPIV